MSTKPQRDSSRQNIFQKEFQQTYFVKLKTFLQNEKKKGKTIYPDDKNIFNAFVCTAFDQIKVVILGQDPYHGPDQAHGLAFSVSQGTQLPPSLKNIYKELSSSFPDNRSTLFPIEYTKNKVTGNLTSRAKNGVLLLNTVLTVEKNKARAHWGKGREIFTDNIIKNISDKRSGIVFLLRGNDAKAKKTLIDPDKHHIIETSHPSPLSAYRGFLGSGCFAKASVFVQQTQRCGQ